MVAFVIFAALALAPGWARSFDMDHRLDDASGIVIRKLSNVQVENLATLGKVWGFLKYYDPRVTSGGQQWDFDLFRVMPKILAAGNRVTADRILVKWIGSLGPVAPCVTCLHLHMKNLELAPRLGWIGDRKRLGSRLSDLLQAIYRNRNGSQFFIRPTKIGNPVFTNERPYRAVEFPDSGYQLLALYRFWNIVEYWYPDRDEIGENWDGVLAQFIPRLAMANSRKEYELQLMALIANIHDTHANLWSSLASRPPDGDCFLPIRVRYIEGQPVVTGNLAGYSQAGEPFRPGDVIAALGSEPVAGLFRQWSPYYGASNTAALDREIATYLTRGTCGGVKMAVRRAGTVVDLLARRVPMPAPPGVPLSPGTNDLPGPAFRLLSKQVAYLKLSSIDPAQESTYIERAAGTKGLIIDIRNYPDAFVVFSLGSLLVDRRTPFVRFTTASTNTPGAFHWAAPESLEPDPKKPHYDGKIVILVDDETQSAAEFAAMAFRSVPDAIVVGNATAGADGNVSRVPLPGGLYTFISGIGVFYPDKKPTQRIGIVPNVVVNPTIADVREGRDPVLAEAIRLIVGPNVPESAIRTMYETRATTR